MTSMFAGSFVDELVQGLPIGLFAIGDGVIVWCNDTFCEIGERPRADIVGQSFVGLVAPEDRPFVVDRYRRRLAGEAVPDHYEFSIIGAASGRRRPIFMVVRVATVGERRYSVGVVVDVTAQAQLAAGILPGAGAGALPATPVLRVSAGVLVIPLIGHFHAARAQELMQTILTACQQQQARALIFDVTGLLDVDARVAEYLTRTVAAARLLGARSVLAGVSPALAMTLASESAGLVGLATAATLEDALRVVQDGR